MIITILMCVFVVTTIVFAGLYFGGRTESELRWHEYQDQLEKRKNAETNYQKLLLEVGAKDDHGEFKGEHCKQCAHVWFKYNEQTGAEELICLLNKRCSDYKQRLEAPE